ncbi:MAG: T9SS type A sorting domain-containing protein, partial [Flavobacteriales bacterium]|nr:T9SS type A sorting domain-containing protein [Flavobacteriales bacterium]
KLSGSGESVLLYDADTLLVDHVDFDEQVTDQGYARVPNGSGPFIIQVPTFGANNDNVGIAEGTAATGFRMYPNPAATQVVLVWDDPVPQPVSIIDATQRKIWSSTLRSGQPIDVSGLAAGSYVVRIAKGAQRLVVVR